MGEIKNAIYDIMADYEIEGLDLYSYGVIEAIQNMLHFEYPSVNYEFDISEWGSCDGGVFAIALASNDDVGLIVFDFKY